MYGLVIPSCSWVAAKEKGNAEITNKFYLWGALAAIRNEFLHY